MEPVDARRLNVHISGFHGLHPIQLGVAYFYRGHYLYSQANTPVEPQLFATKGKILVMGTTADNAPLYDKNSEELVGEEYVNALGKACWMEAQYGQSGEWVEDVGIVGGEAPQSQESSIVAQQHRRAISSSEGLNLCNPPPNAAHISRHHQRNVHVSTDLRSIPPSFDSPSTNTDTDKWLQKNGFTSSQFFTPHDRAQYLAASAPGSRNNSRAPSPSGYASPRDSLLRPIASSTRLDRLLAEEGIVRSGVSTLDTRQLRGVVEGTKDDEAMNYMYPASAPPSRPRSSRSMHSSIPNMNMNTASNLGTPGQQVPSPFVADFPLSAYVHSHTGSGSGTTNTGRPRKASLALNFAYNAANPSSTGHTGYVFGGSDIYPNHPPMQPNFTKCALHGEDCDGITVMNLHRTEAARRTTGFKDLYPVMKVAGRSMVKWRALLAEERVRMI